MASAKTKFFLTGEGKKSRSALICMVAFWVSCVRFVFSGAELSLWKTHVIKFSNLDPTLLGVFMVSCFSLYFGRRATDAFEKVKGPCENGAKAPVTGAVG